MMDVPPDNLPIPRETLAPGEAPASESDDRLPAPEPSPATPLDTAIALLRAGLSVIPIRPDTTKAAAVKWEPYQRERATEEQAAAWWHDGRHGIAIVCGAVSGNVECIDLDRVELQAFRELVEAQAPGLMDRLSIMQTPRQPAGYHVWYRCIAVMIPSNMKLAQEPVTNPTTGKERLDTLIETRGEGGYALVPGSPANCHETGRPYLHASGPPLPQLPDISAAERDILIDTARSFDRSSAAKPKRSVPKAESNGALRPGDAYDRRGPDWSAILEPHGWTLKHTRGAVQYWARPGKDGAGWSATTGYCKSADGVDLLHVFSSNADPFEPRKSYGRFAAVAILNHAGDHKAAARALAMEGYGEQRNGKAKRTQSRDATPTASDADDRDPHLTDMGNGQRFVRDHGRDVRHVWPWRKWLIWDGRRWRIDDTGEAPHRGKQTVRKLYDEAAAKLAALQQATDLDDKVRDQMTTAVKRILDHARKCEDARAIGRMLDLARSEPDIPILPGDLDRDVWDLNVANGTLDLRTGELRPHRQDDFLTKLCPTRYDPAATAPRFLGALDVILGGDRDLLDFLQRSLGYALTGDVREQALPIWWGAGANGKSTIINAILETIGSDYAGMVPAELLMESRGEQHPTIVADLFGKRLMVAAETGQGRRLNESRIKALTGGDKIKARRMREDFWEFSPTHKLIIVSNHRPDVRGTDHAIWRRLRLVPFTVRFLDPAAPENAGKIIPEHLRIDRTLADALRQERAGILAWLVRGCLDWQRRGLPCPPAVQAATAEYRTAEDAVGTFIAECCVTGGPDYRVRAADLYARYAKWAEAARERPMSRKAFGDAMTERGTERFPSNGWWYRSIALMRDPE